VALGHALQLGNGNLAEGALSWLTLALGLAALGLVVPRPVEVERAAGRLLPYALGLGIIWLSEQWMTRTPTYRTAWHEGWVLPVIAATVVASSGLSRRPLLGRVTGPAIALLYALAGAWMLRHTPFPNIDVFVFQREGTAGLLRGENPYTLTFPDIYGASSPFFYGPGVSVNGRLQFGFLYPPLSLFMALPGYLLQGDFRYSQLLANAVAGGLMAFAQPAGSPSGRRELGAAAAFLYLFTPRSLFLLEQGWSEPFVVLLLSATVFVALRRPAVLPWIFGLFACVKQYLFWALPLSWLLGWGGRRWTGFWGRAVAVGAAVSLPLALWSPRAFWNSVVALQWKQPFRPDSLSYWAGRVVAGLSPLSTGWAFGAGAIAVVVALWRAPRNGAGFAASLGLVLTAFFAFNKQAFCNYYSAALGALCVAVAAGREWPPSTPQSEAR